MFLKPDELETLTGYHRHADQRRWLAERGWLFEVSASGRPVVLVSYAEHKLGALSTTQGWQPNIGALA